MEADAGPSMLVLGDTHAAARSPSIVVLEKPALPRSLVRAGETEVPLPFPSILALGEPAPAVTAEKVSAIPQADEAPALPPMVIRGGLIGDASAAPSRPEEDTAAQGVADADEPEDGSAPDPAIIDASGPVYR